MPRIIQSEARWKRGRTELYCGDSLNILPQLLADSIDLIATDPPYFRVKGEDWDRQWDKPAAYLEWLDDVLAEFARVLKSNGSLYLFASPRMAARVEVTVGGQFEVLNRIQWVKNEGWHKRQAKDELRAYFPVREEIIFAEHYHADSHAKGESVYRAKCDELRGFVFEPLRAYLDGERKRAGFTTTGRVDAEWQRMRGTKGCMAGHWFGVSQWELPTSDNYAWLQSLFNASRNGTGPQYLRREYEDLRREYEDLRREYEDLRRPFSVSADVPYTDVWDFPTVQAYRGKHPCEKPAAMIEHIVKASSREGATVLDAFAGSFVAADVCAKLGRRFVGIEKELGYFESAVKRLAS